VHLLPTQPPARQKFTLDGAAPQMGLDHEAFTESLAVA